ncbi:protein arginine n-methyltransferase 5 [Anaeramoeba flamelloides]|uniref:Protein arginine N-methyltransferase n=1 Tax=Anaeramoeba flamelloides TaxID=1746091 RepID=A0ABQ8YQJ2_9EUKA|nr:protein arginine n-methyltransferase 5 [Anaeramoeba flamelloides]
MTNLFLGYLPQTIQDLSLLLSSQVSRFQYNCIVTDLDLIEGPFTKTKNLEKSESFCNYIIGLTSENSTNNLKTLFSELEFANFLGIHHVILRSPSFCNYDQEFEESYVKPLLGNFDTKEQNQKSNEINVEKKEEEKEEEKEKEKQKEKEQKEFVNYARNIAKMFAKFTALNISLSVPIEDQRSWEFWLMVKSFSDSPLLLRLNLVLSDTLPKRKLTELWKSCKPQYITLAISSFVTNKKGFSILPKQFSSLIDEFIQEGCGIIIECENEVEDYQLQQLKQKQKQKQKQETKQINLNLNKIISQTNSIQNNGEENNNTLNYLNNDEDENYSDQFGNFSESLNKVLYLRHLGNKLPKISKFKKSLQEFSDVLQDPLQPLQNNLSSYIYSVFEKDITKYEVYEKAIYLALIDLSKKRNENKNEQKNENDNENENVKNNDQPINVAIAGAGRGPIVKRAIKASMKSNIQINLYAIEKNPSALMVLRSIIWENNQDVTVIAGDMRNLQIDIKFDLIISELLGSFGDNELSPECLDGVQLACLKPNGIMIPQSYSSYLAPVSSFGTWIALKQYSKSNGKNDDQKMKNCLESSYVVRFGCPLLIGNIKKCFVFNHPQDSSILRNNFQSNNHNQRFLKINWIAKQDSVCHGLAGYFTTQLYRDVQLSIHPESHTQKMASWFPLYFPFSQPIKIKKGQIIEIYIWRIGNKKQGGVWYEWTMTKPLQLHIHNPNGRASKIGL